MAEFSPSQEIIRQFTAFIPARAIYVAAKLGVPDHVGVPRGLPHQNSPQHSMLLQKPSIAY